MTLTDPLLSVVMPVYNERASVEEMIRRVLAVKMRIQLIVVDDASTDGTGPLLDQLQRELAFTLLRHTRNAGKGAAPQRNAEDRRNCEAEPSEGEPHPHDGERHADHPCQR